MTFLKLSALFLPFVLLTGCVTINRTYELGTNSNDRDSVESGVFNANCNLVKQTLPAINTISSLTTSTIVEVFATEGSPQVIVESCEQDKDTVIIANSNGEVQISVESNRNYQKSPRVYLSSSFVNLDRLKATGSTTIEIQGVSSNNTIITGSGSSSILFKSTSNQGDKRINSSGSSQIDFVGNQCNQADLLSEGSSSIKFNCSTNNAQLTTDGASKILAEGIRNATANSSGASSIYSSGTQFNSVTSTGASSVSN
ncbi:MAG: GIN domain-containing protein [Patescibacteria group bacterium]